MRPLPGEALHLTYCTNIHPGESWFQVGQHLKANLPAIKRRVVPDASMGVGLRLGALAALELAQPEALEQFRAWLHAEGLYVFTINGFPYGPFHGEAVRERVYRPDWNEAERAEYTHCLAVILAELLPDDVHGSISTVPVGFRPRFTDAATTDGAVVNLARLAARLHTLEQDRGRRVVLALEPEPWCVLERTEDAVRFFERSLWTPAACAEIQRMLGIPRGAAEDVLRERIGLCVDACHLAVMFEEPDGVLPSLRKAGVAVHKVQVSSALQIDINAAAPAVLARLESLQDGVYLHQVTERRDGQTRTWLDLSDALDALRSDPTGPRAWRIHFHVPVFHEGDGPFQTTRHWLERFLGDVVRERACAHLEVETYTWQVLPASLRQGDVTDAIVRELEWTCARVRESARLAHLP